MAVDDLAPLLVKQPPPTLRFGQGRVVSWDPSNFTHTIDWNGVPLTDIPVFAGIDALGFLPGTNVALLGYDAGGGKGVTTWFVLGRLVLPGTDSPDLVVRSSNIIVEDGASIKARYSDGSTAVGWGSLINTATGEPTGHGLLIQDISNGPDIFRAVRRPDGLRGVYVGVAGNFADEFIVGADTISLTDAGQNGIAVVSGSVLVGITATTGDPANLHLSGASGVGTLSRSTSARRYKQDIKGLRVDPHAVLDLKPRTWRDKGEVKQDPDTDRWHVGLIAEEVEDAGLGSFVNYDEQGRPDSIQYDRLTVPLLELCRDQQRQLDALTAWAETQGFKLPVTPAVESTVLPKRMPSTDPSTALRELPCPSPSDHRARRSDPRS